MQNCIDTAVDFHRSRLLVNETRSHGLYSKLVADKIFDLSSAQMNGSTGLSLPSSYSFTGTIPNDGGDRGQYCGWEYLESPNTLGDRNGKMAKKRKLSAAGSDDVDLSLSLGVKANDPSPGRKGSREPSSEISDSLSLLLYSAGSSKPERAKRRFVDMAREGDSSSEEGMVNEGYSCSSNGGLKMRASTLDLTL